MFTNGPQKKSKSEKKSFWGVSTLNSIDASGKKAERTEDDFDADGETNAKEKSEVTDSNNSTQKCHQTIFKKG